MNLFFAAFDLNSIRRLPLYGPAVSDASSVATVKPLWDLDVRSQLGLVTTAKSKSGLESMISRGGAEAPAFSVNSRDLGVACTSTKGDRNKKRPIVTSESKAMPAMPARMATSLEDSGATRSDLSRRRP